MENGIKRFTMGKENKNKYWRNLMQANNLYLSIKKKYEETLQLCKDDGVKFEEIRNFLTNEAKRAGLYVKDYDDGTGKPTFAPKSKLRIQKPAWFVQLNLFMRWVDRNYEGYGEKKVAKKNGTSQVPTSTTGATRDVAVTERKTPEGETITTTSVTAETAFTEPVTAELTPEQIITIISHNWEILGKYCIDHGAEAEFQALMAKLGVEVG